MFGKKQRLIIITISILLIGLLVCFATLHIKKSKDTGGGISDSESIDKTSGSDKNANCFILDGKLSEDKSELIATLSLKGKVSICRYSISLKYDTAVFELIDYDEQLGIYTPVIFPGKDESNKISDESFGRVNLEWASAKNISKEADIVQLKFKVKDKKNTKSDINILVNGVNELNDSEVVKADYNASDLTVKFK